MTKMEELFSLLVDLAKDIKKMNLKLFMG